jgi:hypothetical protein
MRALGKLKMYEVAGLAHGAAHNSLPMHPWPLNSMAQPGRESDQITRNEKETNETTNTYCTRNPA